MYHLLITIHHSPFTNHQSPFTNHWCNGAQGEVQDAQMSREGRMPEVTGVDNFIRKTDLHNCLVPRAGVEPARR